MKLIGILGKSGSGKTTLSRMLQKDESIEVIHLDEIRKNAIKPIADKMPNNLVTEQTNKIGENPIFLNEKLMKAFHAVRKIKLIDNLYQSVLRIPQERKIATEIKRYEQEGKSCVIIERSSIKQFFNI